MREIRAFRYFWPSHRCSTRRDEDELADWRAGRNSMYQLAALTVERRFCLALLFLNR
jgi:hypothetical protein